MNEEKKKWEDELKEIIHKIFWSYITEESGFEKVNLLIHSLLKQQRKNILEEIVKKKYDISIGRGWIRNVVKYSDIENILNAPEPTIKELEK